jgi:hypothetical protein
MQYWKYLGSSVDSSVFIINGIDVWKNEWTDVACPKAEVKDPIYQQDFIFDVYEIKTTSQVIRFAAGEFSNCIWGFYSEE